MNKVGKQKKALVAWRNTVKNKVEGGLGIQPFNEKSKALHMRCCTKLFLELEIAWVQLAQISIQRCLATGSGCKTKRCWTTTEGLLLDEELYILVSLSLETSPRDFNKLVSL